MHHVLLLVLLTQNPAVGAVAPMTQPPSALPTDVATVADLFGLIERELAADKPDAGRLEAGYLRATEAGCDAVLRESGIKDLSTGDRKSLSEDVAERIQGSVQVALDATGAERRRALEDLGRRATTRALPAEVVNRWLGFRDGPDTPSIVKEAQPAGSVSVAAQVTAAAGSADLKLLAQETRVIAEVGGAGSGNGVIDAGEWVHMSFTVANTSHRPWFSSSVTGRADGVCLWTPPHSAELAELPALEGRGDVELWIYASRDCTGGTRRVRLSVRDTHRSPVVDLELTANITPVEVLPPRFLNSRLDTDDLGSSDGSRKKEVGPGLRFEYSLDLILPSTETPTVRMTYAAPKDLQSLFTSFTYRDVPLGRDADKIFRAADDLDATVVGKKAFETVILDARASRRWVTGRWPGRLWLAIDANIEVPRPRETATARAAPAKAVVPSPLEEEKVVALVKRHLSLASHPIDPVLPGSIAAAAGYEIAFDSSRFSEEYRALVWPAPTPGVQAEKASEPLRYRYRLYQSLPLMAIGAQEAAPPVVAETAPPPPVVKENDSPAPPEEAIRFALDLGGTWTGYPADANVDTSIFGSSSLVDVGSISARLMFGRELVGIARVAIGRDGISNDGSGAVHFQETTLEAGLGYVVTLSQKVDLVPRGSLLLNFRSLRGSGSATTPGLEAGLTLRVKVSKGFGFYGDVGGMLGAWGPADLVSGSGFRIGAGISFLF